MGGNLHVRAAGFGFIKGEALARLKDGRSVRVDLELAVLAKPGASAVAHSRQTFVLSYDLWEERFAVTQVGVPSQSISHLTATGAEAWCLERLTVPVSALGQLGRDAPFWIRLQSRIQDVDSQPPSDDGDGVHAARVDRRAEPAAQAGRIRRSRSRRVRSACEADVNRLRNRLIAAFLAATVLPLAATIWITTSLLDRSLGYATTGELDRLSRTLEATVRQFYQREREALKQDALAGRATPTTYTGRRCGRLARCGARVLGERRARAVRRCREPAGITWTTCDGATRR